MQLKNPILMAQIGAPHGIKGDLKVKPFCADPLALNAYGALYTKEGRKLRIKRLRPAKTMLVVKFEGVNSREEASLLNNEEIFIDRSKLPDDIEDDEFYISDLIAMEVQNQKGEPIGRVKTIVNFGAGDLLEIIPSSGTQSKGQSWYLEFTKENVPDINLEEKTLRIVLPDEINAKPNE